MKKIVLLLLILLTSLAAFSQNYTYKYEEVKRQITTDAMGNLRYRNNDGYEAHLKDNTFGEFIFSDNQSNEVKYTKESWAKIMEQFKNDNKASFIWMMKMHRKETSTQAEVRTDVFGAEKTSRNYRETSTIKRDLFGNLVYEDSQRRTASFKKDITDRWKYEDSTGTRVDFSAIEWEKLILVYKNEEPLFKMLVKKYLPSPQ